MTNEYREEKGKWSIEIAQETISKAGKIKLLQSNIIQNKDGQKLFRRAI